MGSAASWPVMEEAAGAVGLPSGPERGTSSICLLWLFTGPEDGPASQSLSEETVSKANPEKGIQEGSESKGVREAGAGNMEGQRTRLPILGEGEGSGLDKYQG